MKIYFQILFIIIIFCKYANGQDLFETSYYDVKFISSDIQNEKINRIEEIKYKSILSIFKKTLYKIEYNKLINILSKGLINTFVKNVIIDQEKIIGNNYFAQLKVNFHKEKIINFYRQNKIPYVEYFPLNFLLIIYEDNKLNKYLFSNNNSYYNYLKKNINYNSLFKIPNLDINDRFLLNKDDLRDRNIKKINMFLKKYQLEHAIIVLASTNNNITDHNILLYSDKKIFEKKLNFEHYDLEIFFQLLEFEVLDLWKKTNSIENNKLSLINCDLNYYNIQELKEIKNNLKKVSVIESLYVKSLSYKTVEYDIYYYGDIKIFNNILKLNQLKLNFNNNLCNIGLK